MEINYGMKEMLLMVLALLVMKAFMLVPWWVVFFPLWFPISLIFLVFILAMLANLIEEIYEQFSR